MKLLFAKRWSLITFMGIALAIFYLIMQDYISVIWYDEICTSDTPINYVLYGKWDSNVWQHTYNPLYAFLLIGWMKIWGVSHVIVCNLNIVLALITFLILEYVLVKNYLIQERKSGVVFVLLFWLGFILSGLFTKGRPDILALLLSVSVCVLAMRDDLALKHYCGIGFLSYLLFLSNVYAIPLISLFFIYLLIIDFKGLGRKQWLIRGSIVATGFVVSFVCICCFYYKQNFLLHYLSTYFSFNSNYNNTLSFPFYVRFFRGYFLHDTISFFLLVIVWIVVVADKGKTYKRYLPILAFVTLIPLLMIIIGRFQQYYVWLFSVPVLILVTIFYDKLQGGILKKVLFAVVILQSLFRPAYWIIKRPAENQERRETERYIFENRNLLTESNVYFVKPSCYYALVECRANIYFLNNDNLKIDSLVVGLCDKFLNSTEYEEYCPSGELPDTGIVINTKNQDEDTTRQYLAKHGFDCYLIDKKENESLYGFKKKPY